MPRRLAASHWCSRQLGAGARRPAARRHDRRPRHGPARGRLRLLGDPGRRPGRPHPSTSGSPWTSGVLGQETTGPGGLAYALRTVPVAARHRRAHPSARARTRGSSTSPTRPASSPRRCSRCSAIASSASVTRRSRWRAGRSARSASTRRPPRSTTSGSTTSAGCVRCASTASTTCPRLLADPAALRRLEEGRLFGAEWLRTLGALPNEYLYYYYFTREAVASILEAPQTRGEFLLGQQAAFYDAVARPPRAGRRGVEPGARAARRDVHARGAVPRARSATRPTSRAAATRGWRWRSWRRSAAR